MLKNLCVILIIILTETIPARAQFVREYKISELKEVDLVRLSFTSYKSLTQLKRVKSQDPIYIHGHLSKSNILPDFGYSTKRNILEAFLVHKNVEPSNLSKSITSKLFSSETDFEHSWDIGLTSNYLYDLDFNLGMGSVDLDLSQIPISNLKVKSASADVLIGYRSDSPNQVGMDTLLVILNMGKVEIQKANFTNSKKIILEVNYGKVEMDFSQGIPLSCQVLAAVGGGSIVLKLPHESNPIKLRMKTTPMCRTTIPRYFKEIENGIFVSKGYSSENPKLLDLILDVGVGSITVE
jgi:hypothetical protein